jgi:hypothetical protein
MSCGFVNDVSFTAKSAIILPDIHKKQQVFGKPSAVLFNVETFAARRAVMRVMEFYNSSHCLRVGAFNVYYPLFVALKKLTRLSTIYQFFEEGQKESNQTLNLQLNTNGLIPTPFFG